MKKTLLVILAVLFIASMSMAGERMVRFSGAKQCSATDSTGPFWFGPFDISECVTDSGAWIPYLAAVGNSVLSTNNLDSVVIFVGSSLSPTDTFGTGTAVAGVDMMTEVVSATAGRLVLATDGTAVTATPQINPGAAAGYTIHKFLPHYAWVKIIHNGGQAGGPGYDNYTYFEGGCIKIADEGWGDDKK